MCTGRGMGVGSSALAAELSDLQHRVSEALKELPGAVALYAFGSLPEGTGDCLSDIDLEIVTTDLDAAINSCHAIWARIGTPILEWRIHPGRSDWAATLLFEDASPYHKIDIGVSEVAVEGEPPVPGQHTLLWRQHPEETRQISSINPPYAPTVGTPEHFVVEQLLGATRYAKARKRGQHFMCYRFASALANAIMSLVYIAQSEDASQLGEKLSTSAYLSMDRTVPARYRLDLLALIDFSSPEAMDRTVYALLRKCLDLLGGIPGATRIPEVLSDRLLTFIEVEQGLWSAEFTSS